MTFLIPETQAERLIREALERGARRLPKVVERTAAILCGCGSPEAAWEWIKNYLASRDEPNETRPADPDPFAEDEDGGRWLLVYLMDHLRLTEHGGNVSSCWLSDEGRELLSFLREHGPDWEENGEWVDSTGCCTGGT